MRSRACSLAFVIACATACGATQEAAPKVAPPSVGPGRMGVHGMIVFGEKRVFMSHIPMLRAPHDAQIVLEVEVPGRRASYSDGLYTFEPERFQLDALVAGEKKEITGTIYKGSFEDGGTPLAKDVRVKVVRVVVSRVPIDRDPAGPAPTYWLVGERDDAYLVHVVGRAPSFDQIVRARVTGGDLIDDTLLARGKTTTLEGRADDLAGRALPGVTLRAVGRGGMFDVQPIAELSCLVGPDFDKPCK